MENNLIASKEIGDYRIEVYTDPCPECPTSWDLTGIFLWNYSDGGGLSRNCSWKEAFGKNACLGDCSINYALRCLILENADCKKIIKALKDKDGEGFFGMKLAYCSNTHCWELFENATKPNVQHHVLGEFEPEELEDGYMFEQLTKLLEKDELVQVVEKYAENIALTEWSSTGYSQGDYVEGIAYCDKERFDKIGFAPDGDWKEKAKSAMLSESKTIGNWMWGNVYWYDLDKKVEFTKHYKDGRPDEDGFEWEEVDSCSGYYCDSPYDLIEEVAKDYKLTEEAETTQMPSVKDLKVVYGDEHQGVLNILWSYECGGIDLFFIGENGKVEYVFGHGSIDDFVGVPGNFAVRSEDYDDALAYNDAFNRYWSMVDDYLYDCFDDYILDNPINNM